MTSRLGIAANVGRLLLTFVTLAALMGVLAAGVAMPAIGATGSAVKGGVDIFNELPGDLTQTPLNQQSKIVDAKNRIIATPYAENRIIVKLKDIAPIMQQAQLAIEDSRFYEHGGLDTRGLGRAVISTLQGNKQGASTLTQQYVKLTLQENARNNGDDEAAAAAAAQKGVAGYSRKLQELKYAIQLEQNLTKDQILEGYLNLAYYGDQAYGVEAAAQHYFSVPASKLDYNQAALLAGTVQLPGKTDPVNFPKAAQARRDVVLERMAELHVITQKQLADAKKIPVGKMLKLKDRQATCQRSDVPYFCSYVMAWLKTQPALGKDVKEREKNINTKGLTIQTPFDIALAQRTLATITAKVPINDPSTVGAAATIIEPGTGHVLAMAQTSNFSDVGKVKGDQVNWNVDEAFGGSIGFQFGSTAKMFALVAALNSGIPVNSTVYAKKSGPKLEAIYTPDENRDDCGWTGEFPVRNDDYWAGGSLPLRTATAKSINTAFASLVFRLGICKVQATETLLGMHEGNGEPMLKYASSVTLGADEVTPITLASAYATLAAKGVYCTPIPVTAVLDVNKKPLKIQGANCKPVISQDVAAGVTELLKGVLTNGTARGSSLADGRQAAGKTGTTNDNVESWFVGYTPQLATAVYVGTPNSARKMQGIKIGGEWYGHVFGGTIAAPLWKRIMDNANRYLNLPATRFPEASSTIVNGVYISVPYVAGLSYDEAVTRLEAAGFSAYKQVVDSGARKGAVIGTSPGGQALKGSAVGILVSSGVAPPPPPPPPPPPTPTDTPTVVPPADPGGGGGGALPQPTPTKTHGGG